MISACRARDVKSKMRGIIRLRTLNSLANALTASTSACANLRPRFAAALCAAAAADALRARVRALVVAAVVLVGHICGENVKGAVDYETQGKAKS